MSTKDKLVALKKLRSSTYKAMMELDAMIKEIKDSGKPHGMLITFANQSKEYRDSIAGLDELIESLTKPAND